MDWQNATDKQRVVLGVLKLPAKSPENLPPVFLNPGVSGALDPTQKEEIVLMQQLS